MPNSKHQALPDERGGLPSASGAEKLYRCPGSWQLEQQAPAEEPSDEALQGTEIHEALETGEMEALDEEGRTIAERLKAMEEDALKRFFAGEKYMGERESRLWITDEKGTALASAKSDAYYISSESEKGLVWDAKTGYLPVTPAFRNVQMRWQAMALWSAYPSLETIRVVISQYRFVGRPDECGYSLEDLKRSRNEFRQKLWEAQQPHPVRNPGVWCRYCRGKSLCKEAGAMSLLPVAYSRLDASEVNSEAITAAIARLSTEELAFLNDRGSTIEAVLKAVRTRLKALPPDELARVGLEKGEDTKQAEIADIEKACEVLYAQDLANEAEIRSCCKMVLGRVEELVVGRLAQKNGTTKKAAAKALRDLLAAAIEYKTRSGRLNQIERKAIQ